MKRAVFTPFAKAQAFGLALGFALALLATDRFDLGIRLFVIATGAAWVSWEFFLGPRAPSHENSFRALAYAFASGFAFPWCGFGLAALAAWAAP